MRRLLVIGGAGGARSLNESMPATLASAGRRGCWLANRASIGRRPTARDDVPLPRLRASDARGRRVHRRNGVGHVRLRSGSVPGRRHDARRTCAGRRAGRAGAVSDAADGYQMANAEIFAAAGAATIIDETDLPSTLDAALAEPCGRCSPTSRDATLWPPRCADWPGPMRPRTLPTRSATFFVEGQTPRSMTRVAGATPQCRCSGRCPSHAIPVYGLHHRSHRRIFLVWRIDAMPTLIEKPTRITAAGNKPKQIEEFVGRVNSGHDTASVARMKIAQRLDGARAAARVYRNVSSCLAACCAWSTKTARWKCRPGKPLSASRANGSATARRQTVPNTSPSVCQHSRPTPFTATRAA